MRRLARGLILLLLALMAMAAGRRFETQINPRYMTTQQQPATHCVELQFLDWVYLPARGKELVAAANPRAGMQRVAFSVDNRDQGEAWPEADGRARLRQDQLGPGLHRVEVSCACDQQGRSQQDQGLVLVRRTERPLLAIWLEGVLLEPGLNSTDDKALDELAAQPGAAAELLHYASEFDVVLLTSDSGCPSRLRQRLRELLFPDLPLVRAQQASLLAEANRDWGGINVALAASEGQAAPLLAAGVRVVDVNPSTGRLSWSRVDSAMLQLLRSQGL